MPTPRLLADLTPHQQTALLRCCTQGIAPDDDTVSPRTIKTLEAKGLIHLRTSRKGRTSWRATDIGRGLVAAHVPRLLAMRSQYGYTRHPHKAMWQEPEAA